MALHSSGFLPDAQSPAGVLRTVLSRPGRPLRELCDAVAYALPREERLHGATLLLVRTRDLPRDRYAEWEFPHAADSPSRARNQARATLAGWDIDEDTSDATELIVSELVTNAWRHGTPPVRLRLILDRGLTCEVQDTAHQLVPSGPAMGTVGDLHTQPEPPCADRLSGGVDDGPVGDAGDSGTLLPHDDLRRQPGHGVW
ncbi:ATP-binding protein [Streptomyces sp. NPDC007251]|uniref:ATP-binding protein n=1 Tax=Streptomyces sp. NPDC007251 TaxID=3154483 RepID=UPI00340EFCB3